jgi:hypothetical protein
LQHVAQLAHVAGPGIVEQRAFRVACQACAGGKEGAGERQHVVAPLGQRRQRELDDAQSVIQVFAKAPFAHRVAQRDVGGGNDPHIRAARDVAAESFVLAGLQNSQ